MFSSELMLPSSLCCLCCLLQPHTERRPICAVFLHQRRSLYDADVLQVCVFRCSETRTVRPRVVPLACPPPTAHIIEKIPKTVHCVKDNSDNVLYILTCDVLMYPVNPQQHSSMNIVVWSAVDTMNLIISSNRIDLLVEV